MDAYFVEAGWLISRFYQLSKTWGILMWLILVQAVWSLVDDVAVTWSGLLQRKIHVLAAWWCGCLLLSSTGVSCLVIQVSADCCAGFCCLVVQELLLGDVRTGVAGLLQLWLAVAPSWYLQRGVMRRPEVILRELSEIALKRAGLWLSEISSEKSCLRGFRWLIGNWHQLWWVCGCDWADSTSAAGY